MADELYEDIKAVERIGKQLAVSTAQRAPRVVAAERGRRSYPNGTVEDYERVEFEPIER